MLRLRRSDRLVMRAVIGALIPAWLALVGFDALMEFAAELDEIGEGEYSAGRAAILMLYTLPRRAYQLFPAAVLLGCVMGLGSLAASSELTALRAIGLSRLRICLGAAFVVAILTAAMSLVAETVGPAGEQRAQALVLAAKTRDLAVARWSGLWAREGDTILNARQGRIEGRGAQAWVALDGVRLYEFAKTGQLTSIALAERAEHRDGQWTLFDVRRSRFLDRRVEATAVAKEIWHSTLDPAVLSLTVMRPPLPGDARHRCRPRIPASQWAGFELVRGRVLGTLVLSGEHVGVVSCGDARGFRLLAFRRIQPAPFRRNRRGPGVFHLPGHCHQHG
jgi:lipopolysaccharide export system permease protein